MRPTATVSMVLSAVAMPKGRNRQAINEKYRTSLSAAAASITAR
jgi:hypothetical protein